MHDQKVNRESHTWVQDRLSEYMDDRLSPLERVQIERHLQTCQQCQQELDSLRWAVSLMKAAPKPKLPRQFTLPVAAAPARAPIFGLSILRLATAVATLILVSLIGIDVITQFGGTASAPVAPLSSAQLAAPTRAALVVATPSELRRDAAAGAAQPASLPSATATSVPATIAPRVTNTSRSAASSSSLAASSSSAASSAPPVAATAALPPAPAATPTPMTLAPKAFSGPASATRAEQPTPTAIPSATPMLLGLGAGPVATPPANKANDSSEASNVPTEIPPTAADFTTEPSPTTEPSVLQSVLAATPTVSVEAFARPTIASPQPTTTVLTNQGIGGLTPLRMAELAALFVAVFLGAVLLLIGLRK